MDDIKDVKVEPLKDSQFVKPSRLNYKQNGVSKIWDLVSLHESVSVIIFNTERQRLVFVKQFRPAVYYSGISKEERAKQKIDTEAFPGSSGLTLELCAGIVDKTTDLATIAKAEVLEECGYSVPVEAFEKVITYRSGVGVSGDRQTMFYVEVTDAMKVSQGGGLASEGEMIDVVEMTLEAARKYLEQPEVNSPGGFLFGLLWFFQNKAPKQNS